MSKLYKAVNDLVDMKSISIKIDSKLSLDVIKMSPQTFRFTYKGDRYTVRDFSEFVYSYFPRYEITEIYKESPADITVRFDKGMDNVVLIRDSLYNNR